MSALVPEVVLLSLKLLEKNEMFLFFRGRI